MIQYVLKKNVNEKMPNAYGKYFAYPIITETYDIDKLVDHMASHNTPFSRGALKGMLTDMVACIRELVLQGIAVKIADLAILSIGIKNKAGAASEKEFTIAKNIEGLKIRARGTGDFSCVNLSLDGTLKKATAISADSTTTDGGANPPTDDNKGGSGTDQSGTGSDQGGTGSDQGGTGSKDDSGGCRPLVVSL